MDLARFLDNAPYKPLFPSRAFCNGDMHVVSNRAYVAGHTPDSDRIDERCDALRSYVFGGGGQRDGHTGY